MYPPRVSANERDSVPSRVPLSFLASNLTGLTDEDGETSDWIELHNPNPYDFNLEGWHLTDNLSNPTK